MVATNPTELRVKRQLLKEYLKRDHVMISLKRPELVSTPAGGVKRSGSWATVDPQQMRLVPILRRMSQFSRNTPDGKVIEYQYALVALYNADVKPQDEFALDGKHYKVEEIDPHAEDRLSANVTYQGPESDAPWVV